MYHLILEVWVALQISMGKAHNPRKNTKHTNQLSSSRLVACIIEVKRYLRVYTTIYNMRSRRTAPLQSPSLFQQTITLARNVICTCDHKPLIALNLFYKMVIVACINRVLSQSWESYCSIKEYEKGTQELPGDALMAYSSTAKQAHRFYIVIHESS